MSGPQPGEPPTDDTALVLERRGSLRLVLLVLVVVGVGGVALVVARSGDDPASSPTTSTAPATITTALATTETSNRPSLSRLPAADDLTEPIWLLAGRSASENTMQLHRIDDTEDRRVNVATGQSQLPGERIRAIRADEAVVWSNGDNLFRVDDELRLIPFTLGPATAVFPVDDDRVWTVSDDNEIVDSPLQPDRPPDVLVPLAGELVAPLSSEVFLLWFQGGVGLWIPGAETSYLGEGLLATTPELSVFSSRRDGSGALVVAATSPFSVLATVPLDVDGIALGEGALSPDGERIAFHLQRGDRIELVVADVADGTTTSLGIFTDRAAPVWLADGRLVVIAAPTGDRQLVWLVSPDGDEPSVPILELDAGRAWSLAIPTP
ncbi:MAG: hypothetical protein AAGA17_06675 [Actinomycetota bacterium]